MKRIKKVDILGTKYDIIWEKGDGHCYDAGGCSGLCDSPSRKIYIQLVESGPGTIENLEAHYAATLRRETIHAFLWESGLGCDTVNNWARNEEMVDYFALQMPKMIADMGKSDCLN